MPYPYGTHHMPARPRMRPSTCGGPWVPQIWPFSRWRFAALKFKFRRLAYAKPLFASQGILTLFCENALFFSDFPPAFGLRPIPWAASTVPRGACRIKRRASHLIFSTGGSVLIWPAAQPPVSARQKNISTDTNCLLSFILCRIIQITKISYLIYMEKVECLLYCPQKKI